MNDTPAHGLPVKAPRRRPIILALAALIGVVAIAAGLWATLASQRRGGRRTELVTPYLNARPGVQYVGDMACVGCHSEIASSFRQHPMGRSLSPIDSGPPEARIEDGSHDLFDAQGFRYSAERRDGRTFHRETRLDAAGHVIAQVEAEVRFVLGSGTRGMSFLIDRDGYLFESPITWYAQGKRWDLAPGYESKNAHFERPITTGCLYCHANQAEHVPETVNRYREPVFRGHAIGCERCHGPGELHVRQPVVAQGAGPNIVNPRKLEPALREDVCQQCHLLGEGTIIERADRNIFEYRPGLPLHKFEAVFVEPPGPARENRNSGHVEQMYESRCFRASQGALGCISCHNPHELPAPEQKVAYYRDRCLKCHAERPCSLPLTTRQVTSPEDSCIACHMPRAAASDIPHLATTIHSIPRYRKPATALTSAPEPSRPDFTIPVPFHADQMSPAELEEAKRDLGVVLYGRGEWGASKALPLLEPALAVQPDDIVAREAEGYSLGALGRAAEGLAAFEIALRQSPNRETALLGAVLLSDRMGQRERSIAYWRRAIFIDPYRSDYYTGLARQLALGGQWEEAAAACRDALRLNPANIQARLDLVQSTFHTGSPTQARAEFDTLLEFNPPDRPGLVRWFESLR